MIFIKPLIGFFLTVFYVKLDEMLFYSLQCVHIMRKLFEDYQNGYFPKVSQRAGLYLKQINL